jgi:uncharacterized membrane protein YkvA (DUF1232 family)
MLITGGKLKMKQIEDQSLESARKKFIGSLIMLVLAVVYLIMPVDLIPDVLPPLTYADDIIVILAACLYSGYSYRKLRKQREAANNVKQQ